MHVTQLVAAASYSATAFVTTSATIIPSATATQCPLLGSEPAVPPQPCAQRPPSLAMSHRSLSAAIDEKVIAVGNLSGILRRRSTGGVAAAQEAAAQEAQQRRRHNVGIIKGATKMRMLDVDVKVGRDQFAGVNGNPGVGTPAWFRTPETPLGLGERVLNQDAPIVAMCEVRAPPQHGLYSDMMARITSDCDAMRSPSTNWPSSPRRRCCCLYKSRSFKYGLPSYGLPCHTMAGMTSNCDVMPGAQARPTPPDRRDARAGLVILLRPRSGHLPSFPPPSRPPSLLTAAASSKLAGPVGLRFDDCHTRAMLGPSHRERHAPSFLPLVVQLLAICCRLLRTPS